MKLLQLNMYGGRLDRQILELVKSENPDILCLQEAVTLKGGEAAMFVTTEEIQLAINANYAFSSPAFSLNYMHRKADFGNCIISKFPITKKEVVFTGKNYVANFDLLKHSANVRNLQHAVLKLPDNSKLHILNHHGHHNPHHKNGDAETMRQCKMIAEEIKKLNGKIILAGDFNLAPTSKSLEQINALLTNLSVKAKLKTTRTALTHKTEVCDYIFVNNEIKVKSFGVSDKLISDHKALIMKFS